MLIGSLQSSVTPTRCNNKQKKRQKMEMILGILVGLVLVASAFTGTGAFFASGITAATGSLPEEGALLSKYASIATRASRSIQNSPRALHLAEDGEKYGQGMRIALSKLNGAVGYIDRGIHWYSRPDAAVRKDQAWRRRVRQHSIFQNMQQD
jgi:hypothetical protein